MGSPGIKSQNLLIPINVKVLCLKTPITVIEPMAAFDRMPYQDNSLNSILHINGIRYCDTESFTEQMLFGQRQR